MRIARLAAIGLLLSGVLVGCRGSDDPVTPSPTITAPSPLPSVTATPAATGDFCVDRFIIGDVYRLIRAGVVTYRQAAASVVAAAKVMRADAASASTDVGARKLRQFALYLNTLRLAILGSVENYPEDFAVKQFTMGLVNRVVDISGELDCPPA